MKASPCGGAIGILTVKKSKDGIFFYFGHNSDSFVSTLYGFGLLENLYTELALSSRLSLP